MNNLLGLMLYALQKPADSERSHRFLFIIGVQVTNLTKLRKVLSKTHCFLLSEQPERQKWAYMLIKRIIQPRQTLALSVISQFVFSPPIRPVKTGDHGS
jgi:hypothetical protein